MCFDESVVCRYYLGREVSYSSLTSILLLLLDHSRGEGEEEGGSTRRQKIKAATNDSKSYNHGRTNSD